MENTKEAVFMVGSIVVTAAMCLVGGMFIGREHMKKEMVGAILRTGEVEVVLSGDIEPGVVVRITGSALLVTGGE